MKKVDNTFETYKFVRNTILLLAIVLAIFSPIFNDKNLILSDYDNINEAFMLIDNINTRPLHHSDITEIYNYDYMV